MVVAAGAGGGATTPTTMTPEIQSVPDVTRIGRLISWKRAREIALEGHQKIERLLREERVAEARFLLRDWDKGDVDDAE